MRAVAIGRASLQTRNLGAQGLGNALCVDDMLLERRLGERRQMATVHLRHAGRVRGVGQVRRRQVAEELVIDEFGSHIFAIEGRVLQLTAR